MTTPSPGLTPSQRSILISLAAAVVLAGVILASVVAFRSSDPLPSAAATSTTPPGATSQTAAPEPVATPAPSTSVTVTTEPESTTTTELATTTTTQAVRDTFVLRPDGIDRMFFGSDADETIAEFTDRLGDPDDDTGWVNNRDRYDGLCLGTEVRFVSWGNLLAFFTDGPSDWAAEGVEHFASYSVTRSPDDLVFRTTLGIGVDATVTEIEIAYGDSARVYSHPVYETIFEVDPPGSGILFGLLTGLDAEDTVMDITGGFACGE